MANQLIIHILLQGKLKTTSFASRATKTAAQRRLFQSLRQSLPSYQITPRYLFLHPIKVEARRKVDVVVGTVIM